MKIENGIPIPDKKAGIYEAIKPMQVGDSIVVVTRTDAGVRMQGNRLGFKFTQRKISKMHKQMADNKPQVKKIPPKLQQRDQSHYKISSKIYSQVSWEKPQSPEYHK